MAHWPTQDKVFESIATRAYKIKKNRKRLIALVYNEAPKTIIFDPLVYEFDRKYFSKKIKFDQCLVEVVIGHH